MLEHKLLIAIVGWLLGQAEERSATTPEETHVRLAVLAAEIKVESILKLPRDFLEISDD